MNTPFVFDFERESWVAASISLARKIREFCKSSGKTYTPRSTSFWVVVDEKAQASLNVLT
jgi:hypothetical protein